PPPALAMHVWNRIASCVEPGAGATIWTGMMRQHRQHAPGSSSFVGVCSSANGSSCASSYSSTYSGSVSPKVLPRHRPHADPQGVDLSCDSVQDRGEACTLSRSLSPRKVASSAEMFREVRSQGLDAEADADARLVVRSSNRRDPVCTASMTRRAVFISRHLLPG